MSKVWTMLWQMLFTAFTAVDDGVATIGIATSTLRAEAQGTADILAIDRTARIAVRSATAQATMAEFLNPEVKSTKK